MRFDLSQDQELAAGATRDLLAKESPVEVSRRISEETDEGFSREHWARLAELGYLGLLAPAAAGGQGLGAIELAVVCLEMGRVCFPGPYLDVVLAAKVLESAGCDEVLAQVAAGREIVVLATGDGGLWPGDKAGVSYRDGRVGGTKYFVPWAASADRIVADAGGRLVLADGPFETSAMKTLDEAERFAELSLDCPAVELGDDSLLGGVAELSAVAVAATALGVCEATMERAVAYSLERETFGRPIGANQSLQHRMADMLVRTESTRATVFRAAWCLDSGGVDAPLVAAAARAYAVASADLCAREALQIHGGNGFTWEYDIHRFLKKTVSLSQRYGSQADMFERALAAVESRVG